MADGLLPTTRVTLLARLRQDPTDQAAWDAFVERYGRHIYRWCRQWKLQDAGAADVTQPSRRTPPQRRGVSPPPPPRRSRGWPKPLAPHAWRDFVDAPRRAQAAAGDDQTWELMQTLEAREDLIQKLQEAFD